jgi:hypothetical protein
VPRHTRFNRGMVHQELVQYRGGGIVKASRTPDRRVTGKMLQMKNPCIQLDDVYCRGTRTAMRLDAHAPSIRTGVRLVEPRRASGRVIRGNA